MKNRTKRVIALILALATIASLCACGSSELTGTSVNSASGSEITQDALLSGLSDTLVMPDGESFTTTFCGALPETTMESDTSSGENVWSLEDVPAADDETVAEWENLVEEQAQQKQRIASELYSADSDEVEIELNSYTEKLRSLWNIGPGVMRSLPHVLQYQVVSFCASFLIDEIKKKSGIDSKSTDEMIMEKIRTLYEIYDKLLEIEEKLDDINERLKNDQYFSAIDSRQNSLMEVSTATHVKYCAVVEYLVDGYEAFIEKSQVFDILKDPDFNPKDYSTEQLKDMLSQNFDEDFLYAKTFMDGEETLSNYMMYRLMYKSDVVVNTLNEWAKSTVDGTSICAEISYLFTSYAGDGTLGNRSYPEIYDYFAYKHYAWEHEGYEYREAIRSSDYAILYEAYTMANIYYTVKSATATKASVVREQKQMADCVAEYNAVQEAHTVVRHEDYYICQIPGCEYVIAKTPVYFDYYSQFKAYFNNLKFEESDEQEIPDKTRTAMDNLFYDVNITYSYDSLPEDLKSKYTFDHTAIGEADNPYDDIDWEAVSGVAYRELYEGKVLYLPQSAYVALYNYYYAAYGYKSLKQIFENVLGIKFADDTHIVCDAADTKCCVDNGGLFSSSTTYYYHQFRLISKELSKRSDYFDLRVCVKDESPSKLYNKRFAGGLNVSTSDQCPINGWGKAENRFGGLMVLAASGSSY